MSKYDVNKFKQVTVALNTPFQPDGSVDLKAVRAVVNYFYNKGIRQMYVCGSTGEGFLLDTQERMAVTESVFQHWTKITEAADLPFFIYNIPQLTGFNLSMDLFRRMLENEKVAGIKCSSDPAQDILRFKLAGGEDFLVFNGPDEQFIAGRLMGADAGIGGTYGAMPELYLKMDDLVNRGEWEKAHMVQNLVTPLIYRLCSFASMHGAVKGIISLDGCPMGNPRLPFLPVSLDDPKLVALYHDIRQAVEDTTDL